MMALTIVVVASAIVGGCMGALLVCMCVAAKRADVNLIIQRGEKNEDENNLRRSAGRNS